ncbi:hypothetical protein AW736_26290 [Termitidicoccus mucosus]|uniref:Uncharacterized protein n=2 Tax=Termitidicoccus mucosus TaxID=1184151 RepID=A0A178IQ14_9BACT|nr:hypothetical protein AW736_26290 [Opitutaceae bacterium TSB47]
MLEGRAVEFDKNRKYAIRRCQKALRLKDNGDAWSRYVTLSSDAEYALSCGLFAPDDDRRTLWQYSHRLFQRLLTGPASELPDCKDFTTRFPGHDILKKKIIPIQRTIAALEKFMQGIVPAEKDFPHQFCPHGFHTYLCLPPRTEGEPVIQPLPLETEFDLGLDSAFEDEDQDKKDDEYQDGDDGMGAAIEDDSEDTLPPQQMLLL